MEQVENNGVKIGPVRYTKSDPDMDIPDVYDNPCPAGYRIWQPDVWQQKAG